MSKFIAFDAGYQTSLKVGYWAVVLVENDKEKLLNYGIVDMDRNTDVEWYAAEIAREAAHAHNVHTIKGDFKACINQMSKDYPHLNWVWIKSKSNPADKWAKYYPELV